MIVCDEITLMNLLSRAQMRRMVEVYIKLAELETKKEVNSIRYPILLKHCHGLLCES